MWIPWRKKKFDGQRLKKKRERITHTKVQSHIEAPSLELSVISNVSITFSRKLSFLPKKWSSNKREIKKKRIRYDCHWTKISNIYDLPSSCVFYLRFVQSAVSLVIDDTPNSKNIQNEKTKKKIWSRKKKTCHCSKFNHLFYINNYIFQDKEQKGNLVNVVFSFSIFFFIYYIWMQQFIDTIMISHINVAVKRTIRIYN